MADAMREALERAELHQRVESLAVFLAVIDGDKKSAELLRELLAENKILLDALRKSNNEKLRSFCESAPKALAQQPAQGEAVAFAMLGLDAGRTYVRDFIKPWEGPNDRYVHPVYAGPPAPSASVPDTMAPSPHHGEYSSGYVNGWNACRAAMLASGGKASVQWETCESQCTCKVCGTVWTAPEPPR